MSPELIKLIKKNINYIQFIKYQSNIFSIGLIILEMILLLNET